MKNEVAKDAEYYLRLPYGIALRKDDEGDWIARVEELPGCVAHGETETQALQHLEEIKTAWIEEAIESGETIPEPRADEDLPSGKWLQRVPRSLHKGLTDVAKREGVSLNQLVTTFLAEAVGRYRIGRSVVVADHMLELSGWSMPQANWSLYQEGQGIGMWKIDPQTPVNFVIDALDSKMCALPNEFQVKVTERVNKKEFAYKS
jgi:antitoxin HicB